MYLRGITRSGCLKIKVFYKSFIFEDVNRSKKNEILCELNLNSEKIEMENSQHFTFINAK